MIQGSDAPERRAATSVPHVHVRIGACDVAIPVDHVIHAVVVPEAGLIRLPRRDGALLGLLQFREAAVPVVSLERWVPMGSVDTPSQARILILRDLDALVGIEVDAVLGVKRIELDAIRRVHHDDHATELFESIAAATPSSPLLSILEVRRLMTLCDVWCSDAEVKTGSLKGADERAPDAESIRTRHAVFSVGGDWWAIPAAVIERVVPARVPELGMRPGNRCIGICEWEGRKLPLVDLSDPGQSKQDPSPWMVVVERGGQAMGLAVQACQQLIDIGVDDLTGLRDDELQAGIAIWPQLGKVRVLNVNKLFASVPETGIHSSSSAEALRALKATSDADSPYIVFEADRPYASHVQDIVGIVELPSAAIDDLVAGKTAAIVWRGKTINVVNMPAINGESTAANTPRLAVLVQTGNSDDAPLGIAIQRLNDWVPAHNVKCSTMRMGTAGQFEMMNLQDSQNSASLVVVDFAKMAYLLS